MNRPAKGGKGLDGRDVHLDRAEYLPKTRAVEKAVLVAGQLPANLLLRSACLKSGVFIVKDFIMCEYSARAQVILCTMFPHRRAAGWLPPR